MKIPLEVVFPGNPEILPEKVIEYVYMPSGDIVVRVEGGESLWFNKHGIHPKSRLIFKGDRMSDRIYCGKCEHLMDGIGFTLSQCYYSENLIDNWKWAKSKFARTPGEINGNNDCTWFEPASTLPKKRSLWNKIFGRI